MKQYVAWFLTLLIVLGLLTARPLLAQSQRARIFYQPGNRVGWLPVPAAVTQAYRRYCPELAADTTLHWYALRDEPIRNDTSTLRFGIDDTYTHPDARLARHTEYRPSVEFKASGEALAYTHETTWESLPWLARRAVRRAERRLVRRYKEPLSLYLLVAFTELQATQAAHRTGYLACFVTNDDSPHLYPAGDFRFWRNGRSIRREPHMKFR